MPLYTPSPAPGTGLESSRKPNHLHESPLPSSCTAFLLGSPSCFELDTHSLLSALCFPTRRLFPFPHGPDPQTPGVQSRPDYPPPRGSPAFHHHLQSNPPRRGPLSWLGTTAQPGQDSLQLDWNWFPGLLTVLSGSGLSHHTWLPCA